MNKLIEMTCARLMNTSRVFAGEKGKEFGNEDLHQR